MLLRRKRKVVPLVRGWDDSVLLFRSRLLVDEKDGADLSAALDRMVERHNPIACQVVAIGSLGVVSYGRAVESIRTYARTGVAVVPDRL